MAASRYRTRAISGLTLLVILGWGLWLFSRSAEKQPLDVSDQPEEPVREHSVERAWDRVKNSGPGHLLLEKNGAITESIQILGRLERSEELRLARDVDDEIAKLRKDIAAKEEALEAGSPLEDLLRIHQIMLAVERLKLVKEAYLGGSYVLEKDYPPKTPPPAGRRVLVRYGVFEFEGERQYLSLSLDYAEAQDPRLESAENVATQVAQAVKEEFVLSWNAKDFEERKQLLEESLEAVRKVREVVRKLREGSIGYSEYSTTRETYSPRILPGFVAVDPHSLIARLKQRS